MDNQILEQLQEALNQKEQSLIQYIKYMREAQDSEHEDLAALYADLAKSNEKHIAVIRDQIAKYSPGFEALDKYRQVNQEVAQESDPPEDFSYLLQ